MSSVSDYLVSNVTDPGLLARKWGVSERAAALHASCLVWDSTNSWNSMDLAGAEHAKKIAALPRYLEAGCAHVSITAASDLSSTETALHYVASYRRFLKEQHGDIVHLVDTVDDLLEARQAGKLAVTLHFQGLRPIFGTLGEEAGNLDLIGLYYDLGVRHAILAHNIRNAVADGCNEPADGGLSSFGIKVVHEMNRVGMMVDCTHVGYRSSMEAVEASSQPVVFSHSNAHGLYPHPRNIRDDQIQACARSGGVVGVCGYGPIVWNNDASVGRIADHIDYMVRLVGPEHVGVGLDYVYDPVLTTLRIKRNLANYGADPKLGYDVDLQDFMPPEEWPLLTQELLNRGHDERAIRGIVGENFLRVARAVWNPQPFAERWR